MNFLLDANNPDITKPLDNLGDIFLYGGKMLLIGLGTVFAVLVLLWFTLVMFKFLFHDLSRSKKTKAIKSEQSAPVYSAPAVSENDEIIAVIAAAIAMAENDCGGNKKFSVVYFKRK